MLKFSHLSCHMSIVLLLPWNLWLCNFICNSRKMSWIVSKVNFIISYVLPSWKSSHPCYTNSQVYLTFSSICHLFDLSLLISERFPQVYILNILLDFFHFCCHILIQISKAYLYLEICCCVAIFVPSLFYPLAKIWEY